MFTDYSESSLIIVIVCSLQLTTVNVAALLSLKYLLSGENSTIRAY